MLTRISLIVAIVAGLAVAGLNFVKVKEKITTLISQRDGEKAEKVAAQTELSSTKKELTVTRKDLESTKTELVSTQGDRDKERAEKESQTRRAVKLTEDLAKVQQGLDDAQAQLHAWNAIGSTPEQLLARLAELKQVKEDLGSLTETNHVFASKIKTLTYRLLRYEDPENYRVELPPDLNGKILVADPKWDFVVLDFGEKQGALEDGVLLVSRNGRLVAKVQIRSVQSNRCIANVLPNWKLGDVMEGDSVIP